MSRMVAWGVGLTVLVTAVLWLAWGRAAVLPGVTFGLLATAIQAVALRVVMPALAQPFGKLIARWGIGMGLRLGGVVVFALASAIARDDFPPLPTAFGYLGVLLPLLVMETRYLR